MPKIKRKYILICLFAIIGGFSHGYFITMIKNRNWSSDSYKVASNNHTFHKKDVESLLASDGIEKAQQYIDELELENEKALKVFLSENPHYVPLIERENNEL